MSGQSGVGLRLFVTGNAEAKRDFDAFKESGKHAFSEIGAGARNANPFLLAFSRTVGETKEKVAGLAEETGSSGRVFASFGTAGILAAAALGGLMVAVEGTKKAMEFGDEIADSATKLGIGTKALQEYRYAIHEAGGETMDADAAIGGFTKALGAAESGLSPKIMKAFAGLGFTKEQLRSFDSVDDAMVAVTAKIAALSSEAERAAVAEKLGMTPLLPLLRKGADGMQDLRAEAEKLGYVMSDELAQKASETHDKMEALDHVIDVQVKSSFIELAPYILQATQELADFTKGLAEFLNNPATARALETIGRITGATVKHGLLGGGIEGMKLYADVAAHPEQYSAIPNLGPVDEDDPDVIRQQFYSWRQMQDQKGTHLTVPTKGAPKKKPTLLQVPLKPDSLLTSIDAETGDFNKPRSDKDWAFHDSTGYFPGEQPKAIKATIDPSIDLTKIDNVMKPWLEETKANLTDTFADGITAAFNGNLLGWIKQKLVGSLTEGLASSLASAFMSATKNGNFGSGSGGTGAFIFNMAAAAFGGGRHAMGGPVYAGQASSVAEYGSELALFGRDGQIYSHDETVRMLQQVAAGGEGGGVTVHTTYAPSYQVTGSGPEVDRLRTEMQRDRDTFHGRVVGAVNDAINRRQIKA